MGKDDKNTLCRQIVETVGDAVIFADRDGIIRLWNRAAEGKVLGPVAVVRDVTARWVREKEMRQRLAFLEAGQTTL